MQLKRDSVLLEPKLLAPELRFAFLQLAGPAIDVPLPLRDGAKLHLGVQLPGHQDLLELAMSATVSWSCSSWWRTSSSQARNSRSLVEWYDDLSVGAHPDGSAPEAISEGP